MKKQNINNKKGFTIIEVVLVLAIAGLIFLMVFVALPALQRSQRDTQRRDDMARFLSQLNQYQSNNNGKVPSDTSFSESAYKDFIDKYLKVGGDTFTDPSTGSDYHVIKLTKCTSGACDSTTTSSTTNGTGTGDTNAKGDSMGEISIYTNAKCAGEKPEYIQGDRKIAITIKLEGAGVYCGNN